MEFETEHATLLQETRGLLEILQAVPDQLEPGEVMHLQHNEFAQRAVWLSHYMGAALALAEMHAYPAGFAALRASLEHHIIDWLLFLGDRYQQIFTGVSAGEWHQYQEAQKAGESWTKNILSWEWQSGTLKVVRSGPHVGGQSETLSVYYGFLSNFDPFRGPPEDQEFLTTDFTEPELHERWARKQQALYSQGLRWDRLRANLKLNGLLSDKELAQLGVHYRFLSAFVHPVSEGYSLLYGRNLPADPPRYDHFASELSLLYVITLALRELKAYKAMASRPPEVGIANWHDVEQRIQRAERLTEYFWFPPGVPPAFDRVEEANHRGLQNGHLVPVGSPQRLAPDELSDDDIRYYRNPLTRLRRMHSTRQEMTGFPYYSPWPRADAEQF